MFGASFCVYTYADHRHVMAEIVVHVERGVFIVGVQDDYVVRHLDQRSRSELVLNARYVVAMSVVKVSIKFSIECKLSQHINQVRRACLYTA